MSNYNKKLQGCVTIDEIDKVDKEIWVNIWYGKHCEREPTKNDKWIIIKNTKCYEVSKIWF